MNFNLSFLPNRSEKPRQNGITMVMDKGLSLNEAENLASSTHQLIDLLKLGFGTSVVSSNIKEKIAIYRSAGIIPYFGGTLFEAFIVRNMFNEFVDFLDKNDVNMVEVSDGSYDIEHKRKLEYINKLAKKYTVISEVGSKKKDVIYSPEEWVAMMRSELLAGSVKVIAEARESGTTGIYNEDGSINSTIIDGIAEHVKLENVIWEAPLKSQQAWFIKNFGENVNLGNIAPNEIIPLESLRLGLRGDTFFQFLPDEMKQ